VLLHGDTCYLMKLVVQGIWQWGMTWRLGYLRRDIGSSIWQFTKYRNFTECSFQSSTGIDELYKVWGG
jgi:hypothetical protein